MFRYAEKVSDHDIDRALLQASNNPYDKAVDYVVHDFEKTTQVSSSIFMQIVNSNVNQRRERLTGNSMTLIVTNDQLVRHLYRSIRHLSSAKVELFSRLDQIGTFISTGLKPAIQRAQ